MLLSGCLGNPYASSIESVNEKAPQTAAAIQVSEPEVYARETLINDRRRESEYLEDLIDKSASVNFEPQLKRVLESIQTIQASANVGYAPSPAANRSEELARAQQEIELKTKQAELANANLTLFRSQQALQAAQAAAAAGTAPPPGSSSPTAPAASADVSTLTAQVKALQEKVTQQTSAIEELKTRIGALTTAAPANPFTNTGAGPISPSSITASPMDLFRDRQAYRSELRAAQASVQLDDGHDVAAHALYRLQFQATIAPGAVKNKFAVVRLKVKPKVLRDNEIASLYSLWLGHVAYRSNGLSGPSDASRDARDPVYLAMGASSDLYRFVDLGSDARRAWFKKRPGLPDDAGAFWRLNAVVPPRLSAAAHRLFGASNLATAGRIAVLNTRWESFTKKLDPSAQSSPSSDTICPLELSDYEEILALQYVAVSMRTMGDWKLLDYRSRADVEALLDRLTQVTQDLDAIKDPSPKWRECEERYGAPKSFVPAAFRETISNYNREEGWSAAYATSPVELSQQISTSAAAMQSLQLGLSLSANMPLQGLTGNGSLNYLQAARGRVEALERLPLAVGFSDRDKCEEDVVVEGRCAVFGWIFGPQAVIDPKSKDIKLIQRLRRYTATVDLSVPSWWPKLEMSLQTSWVGNWHAGQIVTVDKSDDQRKISKTLRPNRADLDSLTDVLSARTLGGAVATTSISEIIPTAIAPCGKDVSLLVFGSNIWRGTEAYLNGVRASEIRTAPDMAGIYIRFDSQLLRQVAHQSDADLIIWTRQGAARKPITLRPSSACRSDELPEPAFGAVVPRLVATSNKFDILFDGPLPSNPSALQVGLVGKAPRNLAVTPTEGSDGRTITLTFNPALSTPNITSGWSDGTVFTAKLKLADPLNAVGQLLRIERDLVFYKTEPTLKLDAGSATIASIDKPFTVIFPLNADKGYDGFDPARLEATVEGGAFPVRVVPIGPSGKGYQYRLELIDGALGSTFKTDDRILSLKLSTGDPIKCDRCLTVKKVPN
ncbi:MAG: hypothetical protein K2Y20_00265 [Sphingomonas sp.]|nr:hypothetical protein [Sphingomonas sp.]